MEQTFIEYYCLVCKEPIPDWPHFGVVFINGQPDLCPNNGHILTELKNTDSPIRWEVK